MKIDINQIPPGGVRLSEEAAACDLDLETEAIKFSSPIHIKAEVSKITNSVTANLTLDTEMQSICSRCLERFTAELKKNITFNYPVDKSQPTIDLNHDIRNEIILDYPMKPLCKADCKGLCPKCGKNLNIEKCNCK